MKPAERALELQLCNGILRALVTLPESFSEVSLCEKKQTVPRAELTAGAKAPDLLSLRPSQVERWIVDANYVYKGVLHLPSSADAPLSPHADLWAQVDLALHENVLPVASKVTSHLGLRAVAEGVINS